MTDDRNLISHLFDRSPIRQLIIDIDHQRVVDLNQAFLDSIGLARDAVIGKTFASLKIPLSPVILDVLRTAPAKYRSEHTLMTISGEVERVRVSCDLVETEMTRYLVVMIDPLETAFSGDHSTEITDEPLIYHPDELLRTLITASPLPIIAYDLEGRITLWNPAAEQLYGWTEAEAMGHALPTIPETKQQEFSEMRLKILQGEQFTNIETIRQKRDASQIDVSVSIAPLHNPAGAVTGFMAINIDITETKKSESQLRILHERNTEILESITDAFYALDTDWRFTYINRKAEHLWGRSRDALLGKVIWEEFPQAVGTHSYLEQHRAVRERQPVHFETVSPLLNLWIEVHVYPSDGMISVYFRDITARKQVEHALNQRTQELESLLHIGQQLLTKLELSELMQQIVEAAVSSSTRTEASSLWLYDEQEKHLVMKASTGFDDNPHELKIPPSKGLIGRVYQQKTAQIIADNATKKVYTHFKAAALRKAQSTVCVPIAYGAETIGVLCADNLSQQNVFQENDVRLLQSLAAQAAIAIQNARLFEQVISGRERMRHLSQQTLLAQEKERKRVASELHDELGQGLLLLKLDLELVLDKLTDDQLGLKVQLQESIRLVDHLTEEMRRLAMELRPSLLDDLGLIPTLEWYLRRYTERTGIKTELVVGEINHRLPENIETALFRTIQEASTNTARYAHAAHLTVKLHQTTDALHVHIEDDGDGFELNSLSNRQTLYETGGTGLTGMTERLETLGGELEIDTAPGQGTRLIMRIPLPDDVE